MPSLPAYRCLEPGCGSHALPRHQRCAAHVAEREAEHNAAQQRWVYRSPRWRTLRKAILLAEPMCRTGCGRKATDIDHVEPLRSMLEHGRDPFDVSLLAPLCHECHARKTMWEQGRLPAPRWLAAIRGIPLPGKESGSTPADIRV